MSLYKRGSTWWIDFTTASGQRVRRSAETESKAEAKELHDKLKAESWRVAKLGDKPKYTWDDAAYQWLIETEHKRTHQSTTCENWLVATHFGAKLVLTEFTREVIVAIGEHKKAETSGSNCKSLSCLDSCHFA